jgi:gluconolactonase
VRLNRSFEYDSLGDRYARFLLEEILPDVAKKYQISDDPTDRAIAGSSSGAICAFNVAWERPDKFRRVLSAVGTYVGLRGGHQFPVLVRKCEAKPIRVFLQDGSNQDMLSSLKWAGYDVMHAWGEGGHNGKQMTAILPDALRWLWRDYPKPIAIGQDGAKRRTEILIPGEDWQEVAAGYRFTEGPAVNDRGEIYFTDIPNSKIFKIGTDGAVSLFAENTDSANGLMMASDGKIYACANGAKQIVAYSVDGKRETIVANVESNDLVIVNHGIYFTDPRNKKVHYFRFDDKSTKVVDTGIEFPNGIVVSPDRSLLYVSDTRGQFVYSFQIQADGTLAYKQPYFHLHVPFGASSTGADGMTVDAEGRLYVTTQMGLQVCDEPGRVHLILAMPQRAWLSNVVIGGPNLDTLYVTCGDKVFQRKIRQ